MSYMYGYPTLGGLGALPTGTTFPAGSEFAVGYTVANLPAGEAGAAVQTLRSAMMDGFRGTTVDVRWGPAFGVPRGVLAVKIRTGVSLTGADLNSIASRVGASFQARLGAGKRVTNSYLHVLGGAGTSGGGAIVPAFPATPSDIPGLTPGTPAFIDDNLGPYPEPGFFSQEVGGIPMWGLFAGGLVAIGAVAFIMTRGKAPAAVKANKGRRKASKGRRKAKAVRRNPRSLAEIAFEIRRDWKAPYFGAVPYINAMSTMGHIGESYGADPGREIVAYFLGNATGWRGPTAKRIKAELNAMLKAPRRNSMGGMEGLR